MNLPWIVYGCDFGANAWFPEGGISRPESRARLELVLARCAEANLGLVRWFVLCDGRAGVVFDAAGVPVGLDAACWRDLDTAITVTSRFPLRLLLVLFDFHWFDRGRIVNGVQLGGRRRVVAQPRGSQALLERVVRPLLATYGRETVIHAWDVVNEPEWATLGYGAANPFAAVRPSRMREWVRGISAAVHSETTQQVTVGLASARGLPLVAGCDLDFYQVHWYDDNELRSPLALPPLENLDRPLLLGEYPTSNSRMSAAEVLEVARTAGYSGALAWSANAADAHSDGSEALSDHLT